LTEKDKAVPQDAIKETLNEKTNDQGTKLSIEGFSPKGDVLFAYDNAQQKISQVFGVNLNYYKPHLVTAFKDQNGNDIPDDKKTET